MSGLGDCRDYCIITVNEDRAENKAHIREVLGSLTEHFPVCVDGSVEAEVLYAFKHACAPLHFRGWHPNVGEVGYWCSLINVLSYIVAVDIPMIVLEDDAEIDDAFLPLLDEYLSVCPVGIDGFQLFTWEDRPNPHAYTVPHRDTPLVIPSWHEWPLGGILLAPSGARELLDIIARSAITMTGDVFIAKAGLFLMAPAPHRPSLIRLRHGVVASTIDGSPPAPKEYMR